MRQTLTIGRMAASAKAFCARPACRQAGCGGVPQETPHGVTDGKAAGAFAGRLFEDCLSQRHDMASGNSAGGLGLPSASTGIKAAPPACRQAGRDGKQKIYGLGCSLAVSVYGENDGHTDKAGALDYCACPFVDSQRAADYQTAAGIRNIIADNGNEDDIFALWVERNIPVRRSLADEYGERTVAHPAPSWLSHHIYFGLSGCRARHQQRHAHADRLPGRMRLPRSEQGRCGSFAEQTVGTPAGSCSQVIKSVKFI